MIHGSWTLDVLGSNEWIPSRGTLFVDVGSGQALEMVISQR